MYYDRVTTSLTHLVVPDEARRWTDGVALVLIEKFRDKSTGSW